MWDHLPVEALIGQAVHCRGQAWRSWVSTLEDIRALPETFETL